VPGMPPNHRAIRCSTSGVDRWLPRGPARVPRDARFPWRTARALAARCSWCAPCRAPGDARCTGEHPSSPDVRRFTPSGSSARATDLAGRPVVWWAGRYAQGRGLVQARDARREGGGSALVVGKDAVTSR
jgi:hypothetical protein